MGVYLLRTLGVVGVAGLCAVAWSAKHDLGTFHQGGAAFSTPTTTSLSNALANTAGQHDRPTVSADAQQDVSVKALPAADRPLPDDLDSVRAEIGELEDQISEDDAIARLNSGDTSEADRARYGLIFQRLTALRMKEFNTRLAAVAEQANALKDRHEHRLADFGIQAHDKAAK